MVHEQFVGKTSEAETNLNLLIQEVQ